MEKSSSRDSSARCTVYYDGACPLCQREINLYQGLDSEHAIVWHDVSRVETGAADLETQQAMARFHVRRADGTLVSGARAFLLVMQTLPRLRWLGRLLGIAPIPWLAEGAYRAFLPLRPALSRLLPQAGRRPRHDA